jgi:hypothetical protein
MRLENAYLCECGLVGINSMQCDCGNREGLLNLATVLNRKIVSREAQAVLGMQADALREKVYA